MPITSLFLSSSQDFFLRKELKTCKQSIGICLHCLLITNFVCSLRNKIVLKVDQDHRIDAIYRPICLGLI